MKAVERWGRLLDIKETSAETLLALAAVTLVLGATYWLIRERDERAGRVSK